MLKIIVEAVFILIGVIGIPASFLLKNETIDKEGLFGSSGHPISDFILQLFDEVAPGEKTKRIYRRTIIFLACLACLLMGLAILFLA